MGDTPQRKKELPAHLRNWIRAMDECAPLSDPDWEKPKQQAEKPERAAEKEHAACMKNAMRPVRER